MVRLGLIRLIVVVLCVFLAKANDVPEASLLSSEVSADGSIGTPVDEIAGATSGDAPTLTEEEDATIRAIVKQLEEKDLALRAAQIEVERMAAEQAKLKAAFEQTQTELDKIKSMPAPEPVKITEKDPATEAALLKVTAELNAVKLELKEVEDKAASAAAEAASAASAASAAAAAAAAVSDTTETDKLTAALSTCRATSDAVAADLQSKTVLIAELENEAAALRASAKPKLSNLKEDTIGKSANDDDSEEPLSLEGFVVFLRGKYAAFEADLYASPVLGQIASTAEPIYQNTRRYIVDVVVPYCRDDMVPMIKTFYLKRFLPFVSDTTKLLVRSYEVARPQVVEAIASGRAFIVDVAVPAYRQHVAPPLVGMYKANVAPTVDQVIVPWYTVNVAPHVKTATIETNKFYKTHLRRHVEPTLSFVWRKVNYYTYKLMNFLDAENLYDQVVLLSQDVSNIAQLAHDTFTSYLRKHPLMQKMCGKNLDSAIMVMEYCSALFILLLLRKLVLFIIRSALLVVLSPVLVVYWMLSAVQRLIFGKQNLRAPKKLGQQKYANTGTAYANPSATSPACKSSAHAYGSRDETDTVGSSFPPSAVSKPSRPPRSSNAHVGAATAFVGSPVPQHANDQDA